jgi:Raf kinase inhibitor-like YbhB/YbcL family protein
VTRLFAIAGALLTVSAAVAGAAVAEHVSTLRLSSPAFAAGGRIPRSFTCDGAEKIVPLRWSGVPAGTRSFAVVVDDPDAPSGTFTHRLAWAIPAAARSLAGRAPREGSTSAGRVGWVGPCPPSGVHRYVFRLYALRSPLRLDAGADRAALLAALKGHVLASATLIGRYGR